MSLGCRGREYDTCTTAEKSFSWQHWIYNRIASCEYYKILLFFNGALPETFHIKSCQLQVSYSGHRFGMQFVKRQLISHSTFVT